MRIGVDVGGTNTDAVLMRGSEVVASIKTPTTADIGAGVVAAVRDVLGRSGAGAAEIESVMIGTTQFTNAFVERRRLVEVAIIRLALPATESLNPLIDWPKPLVQALGNHIDIMGHAAQVGADDGEVGMLFEHVVAGGNNALPARPFVLSVHVPLRVL